MSKSNPVGQPKALWRRDPEGCRAIPLDHDWGVLEGCGALLNEED